MNAPPPLRTDQALFLDLDGTLIEIAEHPIDVVVPVGLKLTLTAARAQLGGALALVSGRSLAQIDLLFGGYPFDVAGSHGSEWRCTGGMDVIEAPPASALEEVVSHIAAAARSDRGLYIGGLYIERKPHSIALHFRADPSLAGEAWRLAREGLAILGADYRLQEGKAVVEILPASAQKGSAIDRFMQSLPYLGRVPLFAGDDLTDESGFEAVNLRHGISIRIGDPGGETRAQYLLPSPAALREWLESSL